MDKDPPAARPRGIRVPRGSSRLFGATGLAAVVGSAMLVALRRAPAAADAFVARRHLIHAQTDVAYWSSEDPLSGFLTYAFTLAIVLGIVAAYVALERLVSHPRVARVGRPLLPLAAIVTFIVEYRARQLVYPRFVIAGALAIIALLVVAARGGGGSRVRPTSGRGTALFVLVAETMSLAWGGWVVTINNDGATSVHDAWMAVFFAVSFGAWRIFGALDGTTKKDRGVGANGDALAHEAVGGLPFLLTPLFGFFRAPSPWFVVVVVGIAATLRELSRSRSWKLPDWVPAIAAPLAIAAIVVIPLGIRDLQSISIRDHEAQHLGWINSALDGKLLMADAGTIYGPVREYLLTAWCLVSGTTLLQVRIAHVLLNLVGLGVMLGVGWRLVGRNVWLHAWLAIALVIYTPLWTMLVYKTEVALGWADLARPGWAILGLAGAVAALLDLDGTALTRARLLRVAAWGGAMLLSVLYSQEQGLCALGAVIVVAVAHPILARRERVARRFVIALAGAGAYVGGFAAALLVWLGWYATHGRAHLFLSTFLQGTELGASGAWGAYPFPIHPASFSSFVQLTSGNGQDGGAAHEYLVAPAVYIFTGAALLTRAARGRWNDRATLMLALELLGITSFRVAMHRSDAYHLLS